MRRAQLYSNGVLIMDKCADLLPEHFRFVRGVVDSDLSLNISRELLQHDRQLKVIAANLEKKIKSELGKLLKDDREGYEKFWKNFGRQAQVRRGQRVRRPQGPALRPAAVLLLQVEKAPSLWPVHLPQMKEGQGFIYYFAARESPGEDRSSPTQTRACGRAFWRSLYFTEEVDEFCAQILHAYQDKEFRSVLDQEIAEGDEKKAQEAADAHKAALPDFVEGDPGRQGQGGPGLRPSQVPPRVTAGLLQMEKCGRSAGRRHPRRPDPGAERGVPGLRRPGGRRGGLEGRRSKYQALYSQALLIAGLPLEDPAGYTDLVCGLMK